MFIDTQHKVDISIKFGELDNILTWCKKNCKGDWKFRLEYSNSSEVWDYQFYFENDSDKLNFILWQK